MTLSLELAGGQLEDAAHLLAQVIHHHGLVEEGARPHQPASLTARVVLERREHHERRGKQEGVGPYRGAQREPVHLRHLDIGDDQIRLDLPGESEPPDSVARLEEFQPPPHQIHLDEVGDGLRVLDDEYLHSSFPSTNSPPVIVGTSRRDRRSAWTGWRDSPPPARCVSSLPRCPASPPSARSSPRRSAPRQWSAGACCRRSAGPPTRSRASGPTTP